MPEATRSASPRVARRSPGLVVFAPSPLLTIMIEGAETPHQEIHLHAGGQGLWVARMAALLGAHVGMCCALGGESGAVLRALIARERVALLDTGCAAANGVYVHARRKGVREELARTRSTGLSRHEVDELYGVMLSAALDVPLAMLAGVDPPDAIEPDIYRRLAGDLRGNGVIVVADLSGPALRAALAGGLDVLKLSDEELRREQSIRGSQVEDLLAGARALHEAGAHTVLVSRADAPSLVLDGDGGRCMQLTGPRVEALEPRGAGDSMFAALGVSLARGTDLEGALRMAMAAGCLNATRHGLGTGTREQIERLSHHIEIQPIAGPTASLAGGR